MSTKPSRCCSAVIWSFLALALTGCVLGDVAERGEVCPPEGIGGKLSFIQMGPVSQCHDGDNCYTKTFTLGICPIEYDGCYLDSEDRFYCMSSCPPEQVPCNGSCINPKTDLDYCGASNTCTEYGCCTGGTKCSWWETCQDGRCIDTACTEGKTRCRDGVMSKCQNGVWVDGEICKKALCNDEQTACAVIMACEVDDAIVQDGAKACNKNNQIVTCNSGVPSVVESCSDHEVCALADSEYACIPYNPNPCLFNNTIIEHMKSVCDGNILRQCRDGKLTEGKACPIAENSNKTVCGIDQCVVPIGCPEDDHVYPHGSPKCQNSKILQCYNGSFIDDVDCAERTDGAVFCRNEECVVPNDCLNDNLKHDEYACDSHNVLLKCQDGEMIQFKDCGEDARCTIEGCIKNYTTIRSIHEDYGKFVNTATCSANGTVITPADISIDGVVTAVKGQNGFFIQEPSSDGRYSGINVSCAKSKKCTTLPDGSQLQVGDNVHVTGFAINSYYCQIQIYTPDIDVVVKKNDKTDKIDPIQISADIVLDDGVSSANNAYNGSLVRISPVTAKETVSETLGNKEYDEGWRSADANNTPVLIGTSFIPIDMVKESNYDVTGIVTYSHNHLHIAPRTAEDIVPYEICAPGEDATKCIKLSGQEQIVKCENGDETSNRNCTAMNHVCDSELLACRLPVSCTGHSDTKVSEGKTGCKTVNTMATCTYDNGVGVWNYSLTCLDGCDLETGTCFAPSLKQCAYTQLNENTRQSTIEAIVPSGSDVSFEIKCTTQADSGSNIAKWPYTIATHVNDHCTTCTTKTQYLSEVSMMPGGEGKYVCVAIAHVKNGKSFICPVEMPPSEAGLPEFTNSSRLSNLTEVSHSYTISRPILAYWNFNNQTTEVDSHSVKLSSTIELANANYKKVITFVGSGTDYAAAAQPGWNSDAYPDYSKPYWKISLDTKDYHSISLSFMVKASSDKPKSFRMAYWLPNGQFEQFGKDITFSDANQKWHEWSGELPAGADNADNLIIGIFPYAAPESANVRLDEIRITGDPM